MIRFRFEGNEEHRVPIVFLGLSDRDVERLSAGETMRISSSDKIAVNIDVVLFQGRDDATMTRSLEMLGFMGPGSSAKITGDRGSS